MPSYCSKCYLMFEENTCPHCQAVGQAPQADDPVFLGELPGPMRNAMQIAFSATELPFTALPSLGAGFTMSAGDIFESYRVYVPYERLDEARTAFQGVLDQYYQ